MRWSARHRARALTAAPDVHTAAPLPHKPSLACTAGADPRHHRQYSAQGALGRLVGMPAHGLVYQDITDTDIWHDPARRTGRLGNTATPPTAFDQLQVVPRAIRGRTGPVVVRKAVRNLLPWHGSESRVRGRHAGRRREAPLPPYLRCGGVRRQTETRPSRSDDAEDPQEEQGQQDGEHQRAKATQPTREEEEHTRWMPRRGTARHEVCQVSPARRCSSAPWAHPGSWIGPRRPGRKSIRRRAAVPTLRTLGVSAPT